MVETFLLRKILDSVGLFAADCTALPRSVSSAAGRPRVAKPVRRSKSQLPGSKFVTNIRHGGSVTLVSLTEQGPAGDPSRQFHPIEPDLGRPDTNSPPPSSAFTGSNTLPRALARRRPGPGPAEQTVDDSEIVITKRLTGAGSSVRIRDHT